MGSGSAVAMLQVGKEDKESQVAEASHMNKEKRKGPEALKVRFQEWTRPPPSPGVH